jgi:hypothetical protein
MLLPRPASGWDSPMSTSQVAGIPGVHYHVQPGCNYFYKFNMQFSISLVNGMSCVGVRFCCVHVSVFYLAHVSPNLFFSLDLGT